MRFILVYMMNWSTKKISIFVEKQIVVRYEDKDLYTMPMLVVSLLHSI